MPSNSVDPGRRYWWFACFVLHTSEVQTDLMRVQVTDCAEAGYTVWAWATARADMPTDSMPGQQRELEEWRAGIPSRTLGRSGSVHWGRESGVQPKSCMEHWLVPCAQATSAC